jgi:excisionase family DNA binding protein
MENSLTVAEAAELLGVTEDAVRKLLHADRLDATRRGRAWAIDRGSLERLQRQRPNRGRPLSPPVSWGAILAWSQLEPDPGDVDAVSAYRRGEDWLRRHDVAVDGAALRSRAVAERFRAHPSAMRHLAEDSSCLRGGSPAASLSGLVGSSEVTSHELYAPQGARDRIVATYGLLEGRGDLLVRWVDDALWNRIAGAARQEGADVAWGTAVPRCAALLDCLEDDDPRVRRVASDQLRRIG